MEPVGSQRDWTLCIVCIAKGLSKGAPDPRAVALELDQLCGALGILEDRLVGPYLLGDDFTVGDLNLALTRHEPGEDGISGIAAMDLVPSQMSGAGSIVAVRGLMSVGIDAEIRFRRTPMRAGRCGRQVPTITLQIVV